MPRHFNVEDLSFCVANDEEDVKRLEQDGRDAEKVADPNVRCVPRQELSPRPGWAPVATHSHKPETPTLSIRPGCAFDPKGGSRKPCVRSELVALPGSPSDHLLLDEKIATSSTLSTPLAASPELFLVSQSATDYANRRTIDLPESKSADRRRSDEAADADAAATTNCWRRQRFSAISSAGAGPRPLAN
jgi:hypothetical protein